MSDGLKGYLFGILTTSLVYVVLELTGASDALRSFGKAIAKTMFN